MALSVSKDKRKLTALIKRLAKFDGTVMEAGFFEDEKYGPENGNLHVAEVAAYNEFGTTHNPTRPFMAPSFLEKYTQAAYAKVMKNIFLDQLVNGRQTQRLLKNLGEMVVDVIQVNIDDFPGSNSRRWIEVKGFNDPLFYTGRMLESVKFQIRR